MFALLVALLAAWIVLGAVGIAVQGLMWLFWICLVAFIATAIAGWVGRDVGKLREQ